MSCVVNLLRLRVSLTCLNIVATPAYLLLTTRYWIYLGNKYTELLPQVDLPDDYKRHFALKYSERADELHLDLCRLALFLDPRYKDAACSDTKYFRPLLLLVSLLTCVLKLTHGCIEAVSRGLASSKLAHLTFAHCGLVAACT
jgi:hypothetical protein